MNKQIIRQIAGGFMLGLIVVASAEAAIQPHALFSDNSVLQQKVKVPVWGTTDQTEKVTVNIAGQDVSTMPIDGKWRVELAPLAAGGPHVLVISQGGARLELKNVLVGEVWICGGQSNMQWALKQSAGGSEAIAMAGNEKIRLFTVPRRGTDKPEANVVGNWTVAAPDTVGDFSGVGYFFGRDLQKHLVVPVGLIASNLGGTAAEQWMSKESIESNPDLKDMSKPQGASTLYNAMIAPLAPYAIAGVIWYQGESNAPRAYQYRKLLPAMIKNWRDTFAQGDFPFLIVQIAPYEAIVPEPSDSIWAEVRDAQLYVSQTVPKTALAVITDVGDEKDIHPQRKEPVGARLALAAQAIAYGEKVEYSGPLYDNMTVSGDKAVLRFKHVGSGLVAKGGPLTGFTIAGEDQKFHTANATIEGDTIVVSSDKVAKPVAVRYGWAAYPVVNLWNKEDLPASPFRTDAFPITTQDKK
ncbi:MAG: sialate O-acetylesterase [Planctomycetia bacterium]|nr:sialate O-acetylesterase [Planctomycetia bacterium]